jgi:hypothetical protein
MGGISEEQYPLMHRMSLPEHEGKFTPHRPASTNRSNDLLDSMMQSSIPPNKIINTAPANCFSRMFVSINISYLH